MATQRGSGAKCGGLKIVRIYILDTFEQRKGRDNNVMGSSGQYYFSGKVICNLSDHIENVIGYSDSIQQEAKEAMHLLRQGTFAALTNVDMNTKGIKLSAKTQVL